VYSKERSQTHYIARHFSRSISVSFICKNTTPKALPLSFSEESKGKNIDLNSKTPTASRVTTGRLSSKKVLSLKLSAAFPALTPKEKSSTIS